MSSEPLPATTNPGTDLYVDLDGTLVRTDMLLESLVRFLKLHPWRFLSVFAWALRGPQVLKAKLAESYDLSAKLLPWNQELLSYLREQRARGRTLVLATAANEKLARVVASEAGIFSDVLASTATHNLKGSRKADAILAHARGRAFCYAGNEMVDVPIWKRADAAIVVGAGRVTSAAARKATRIEQEFPRQHSWLRAAVRAARPHQWAKNALVFFPLVTAHAWTDVRNFFLAVAAAIAFSLCASAIYLVNDLLDLPNDRNHPRKSRRPLAAGTLPIKDALWISPLLLFCGCAIAWYVSVPFLICTLAYVAITLMYSLLLKTYVLIDVLTLAALYTIRVIAGAVAIAVVPSFWLLAFSMFLFLSLALVKRVSEIHTLLSKQQASADGRDYNVSDQGVLQAVGVAAGFGAVIVVALFINSPDVMNQYSRPLMLWGLCPAILYWIARMWLKAARAEMDDDPLVYALRDRGSQVMGLVSIALILSAV